MAATYKFYKNPPKEGEVGKQELHAVMEDLLMLIAAEKVEKLATGKTVLKEISKIMKG